MLDIRALVDLPEGVDARDHTVLRLKSLRSQSTDGAMRLVYDVTGEMPRLCVLHVASNTVMPFRTRHLGGRTFTPAPHNAIDLLYALTREVEAGLTASFVIESMWKLIRSGAITQQPSGESDAVTVTVNRLREAAIGQAVEQLYPTGVISGEPLFASLRETRAQLAETELGQAAEMEPIFTTIDRTIERWTTVPEKIGDEDHSAMAALLIALTTIMGMLHERDNPYEFVVDPNVRRI